MHGQRIHISTRHALERRYRPRFAEVSSALPERLLERDRRSSADDKRVGNGRVRATRRFVETPYDDRRRNRVRRSDATTFPGTDSRNARIAPRLRSGSHLFCVQFNARRPIPTTGAVNQPDLCTTDSSKRNPTPLGPHLCPAGRCQWLAGFDFS